MNSEDIISINDYYARLRQKGGENAFLILTWNVIYVEAIDMHLEYVLVVTK